MPNYSSQGNAVLCPTLATRVCHLLPKSCSTTKTSRDPESNRVSETRVQGALPVFEVCLGPIALTPGWPWPMPSHVFERISACSGSIKQLLAKHGSGRRNRRHSELYPRFPSSCISMPSTSYNLKPETLSRLGRVSFCCTSWIQYAENVFFCGTPSVCCRV